MFGYLLELGLTVKQAEMFTYYLSIMVRHERPDNTDTYLFQDALKNLQNLGQ